jgi:dephospho-CoA kinase
MKIIGLTGGIAAGKNFVSEIFAQNGAAIFDADAQVHELFELDKLVISRVAKNFSESLVENKIDRKILSKLVFANEKKSKKNLEILEKILHPKVRQKYDEFLIKSRQENRNLVVLNVPLLLENKGYECEKIVAIIAPKSVQKKRFLARAKKLAQKNDNRFDDKSDEKIDDKIAKKLGNRFDEKSGKKIAKKTNDKKNFALDKVGLEKKFEQIHSKQIKNSQRKNQSDFVINSGFSKLTTIFQVKKIINELTSGA